MQQELIFEIEAPKQATIYHYLRCEQAFSKRLLKKIQYTGEVWQSGHKCRLKDQLEAGTLRVLLPIEQRSPNLVAAKQPLVICYEDEWFLVVDKPAGLLSIPSWQDNHDSLIQRVLAHYEHQGLIDVTAHIVTRLDKGTSGLVLIAKNHYAKQQLHGQKIIRRYYAAVWGQLTTEVGEITWPIRRVQGIKRECHDEGQAAQTHYRLKQRGQGCDLVELELKTGRTHQIRVHMATLGHPLLGDSLYGHAPSGSSPYLQSYYLEFQHPVTKNKIRVELPLAEKLIQACNSAQN